MIALVKNGEDQRSMEMENGYDREKRMEKDLGVKKRIPWFVAQKEGKDIAD